MSYYQRPMGDYKTYGYAGDPGFLSSLWKGIKTVGKALFTPAPQVIQQMLPAPAAPPVTTGFMPGAGARGPSMPSFQPPATGPGGYAEGHPGQKPLQGFHWAKDGSGKMVRNRRMNIANPRALRRAMRRVQGFEKLAKRTISFTRRTKMKKRASS